MLVTSSCCSVSGPFRGTPALGSRAPVTPCVRVKVLPECPAVCLRICAAGSSPNYGFPCDASGSGGGIVGISLNDYISVLLNRRLKAHTLILFLQVQGWTDQTCMNQVGELRSEHLGFVTRLAIATQGGRCYTRSVIQFALKENPMANAQGAAATASGGGRATLEEPLTLTLLSTTVEAPAVTVITLAAPQAKRFPAAPAPFYAVQWKAGDGRVTLGFQMIVTCVQTTAPDGTYMEYTDVWLDGTSFNPCRGWCPELHISLLGPSNEQLMTINSGRFACDCGNHIHRDLHQVHDRRIFELISNVTWLGDQYDWKPC